MTALVLVLAAVLLVVLFRYFRPGDGQRLMGRPLTEEARWEAQVLRLTRGDRGAMERAVKNRALKFPQASRAELLKLVHDEYVKDRE